MTTLEHFTADDVLDEIEMVGDYLNIIRVTASREVDKTSIMLNVCCRAVIHLAEIIDALSRGRNLPMWNAPDMEQ